MSSQKFLKARFHREKISSTSVMVSSKFLRKIGQMLKWLFQFLAMEVIDVEINLKTSLERVSEKVPYKARNFKETCKSQSPMQSPSESE